MALEDFNNGSGPQYYWNSKGFGELHNYGADRMLFGRGKDNTKAMITKLNAGEYGADSEEDLWDNIQEEVAKGWFVPSNAEWSAFGGELEINGSNYGSYGLHDWYWSSSRLISGLAWYAFFYDECMIIGVDVVYNGCVRLSATF